MTALIALLWPAAAIVAVWPQLGSTLARLCVVGVAILLAPLNVPELAPLAPGPLLTARSVMQLEYLNLPELASSHALLRVASGGWAQALLVVVLGPILLPLLLISRSQGYNPEREAAQRPNAVGALLSKEMGSSQLVDLCNRWAERGIAGRSVVIVAIYFALVVGAGRFLPFVCMHFKAWLRSLAISGWSKVAFLCLTYSGMLSCIPIVPAVLVYIELGIALGGTDALVSWGVDGESDIWIGAAAAAFAGALVKLFAVAGQWAIGRLWLGERLGQGAAIRDAPGHKAAIAALTSFGPDWISGVLCGAMNAPCTWCILGALPGAALAGPGAIVGVLLQRENGDPAQNGGWGVWSLIVVMITALCHGGAAALTVSHVAEHLKSKGKPPTSAPLEASDAPQSEPSAFARRVALATATILSAGAFFAVIAFDALCFRGAARNGNDEASLGESLRGLMHPMGAVAFGLLATGLAIVAAAGDNFGFSIGKLRSDIMDKSSRIIPYD